MQQPVFSPTPRQSKPAALYTAVGSFGSPSWMPRLKAVEIAGFGIRQQYQQDVTKAKKARSLSPPSGALRRIIVAKARHH